MPARERLQIAQDDLPPAARTRRGKRGRAGAEPKTRRDEILEAAITSLNRNGLRGMTLAQVADRLHLAPTAVGYYFRRKEDLAAACYLSGIERMQQLVTKAAEFGDQGPQALLRSFFEARRRIEIGELPDVVSFEDIRTLNNQVVFDAYIVLFRQIRSLFGPAPTDAARVSRNIRAHLFLHQLYWAITWLPQYHPRDYARMAERVIDICEKGLAAPGCDPAPLPLTPRLVDDQHDARQLFLRAATEMINEHGYLGASVQKISQRLNVTKGAFYHRHDAKNDLVVQCFERTWTIVAETQFAADEATGSALSNLTSVVSVLVEGVLTGESPLIRSAALAAVPLEMRAGLIGGFNRTAARFGSVISDGLVDKSVRPVDVPVAAQVLTGAINQAPELHFWAPGVAPKEMAALYVQSVFTGMLGR